MKIIAFDRRADMSITLPPAVELIADSAVVLPQQPLFLPDFDCEWEARLCPVYRIGRLGKTITAKFAPRYIDAFSLALRLIPVGTDKALRAAGLPIGIEGLFDSAIVLGRWTDTDPDNTTGGLEITCGGVASKIENHFEAACQALEAVSRYATVKTGDVISPSWLPAAVVPAVGATIEAAVNGEECLNVRIR